MPLNRSALVGAPIAMTIALALCSTARVHAQNNITIYRCVDASGAVALQNNIPCPKGSQQTVRQVGVLPTLPAPRAAPVKAPAAVPTQPTAPAPLAAAPAPAVRGAPPPLFQCSTWDQRDYLGDTAEPPATCAPVQSVGIDGSAELGAGTTCEMRQDACVLVPAEQLCASWKKRVDEAEFRWKFGGGRNDDRKAEFDRLSTTYRQSTCLGG